MYAFLVNFILIYIFNKLQAPVQGCTKIPGGECHIHRNWDTEFLQWFMSGCIGRSRLGTSAGVWVSWHDYCPCTKTFPALNEEADDHDVI